MSLQSATFTVNTSAPVLLASAPVARAVTAYIAGPNELVLGASDVTATTGYNLDALPVAGTGYILELPAGDEVYGISTEGSFTVTVLVTGGD